MTFDMDANKLEAKMLHAAILNACIKLIEQKEKLNAINVFPVADGDTGDNMASTAMAIVTQAQPESALKATLKSISDAAIAGARGNSGMIFSQFFNGLYKHFNAESGLDAINFSTLVKKASESVRQSILNPVEGTILTIIDTWAEQLSLLTKASNCFKTILKSALAPLEEALKKTENSLEILKRAHFVDAGALGFYHFVKGFTEYINQPTELPKQIYFPTKTVADHHHDDGTEPPVKRYCTEALLSAAELDQEALAALLDKYGDSAVISSNGQLCRFHVHSNEPAALFLELTKLGKISQPKVDDMIRQYELIHTRKHAIALVTDSSANLPEALIDHHQIHIIPLQLYLDDHQLLDYYCIPSHSLYSILKSLKQYPKTSMPSLQMVKEKLHRLAEYYDEVLVISLSQALSGTHDIFKQAASEKSNIHVINSKHTAGTQGLLVKYAAECIEKRMSIASIKQKLLQKRNDTRIFVMIDQFDSLIRSGRIGKISGMLAQFSHIKPIITMNQEGQVDVVEKTFHRSKGLKRMIAHAAKMQEKGVLLGYNILHTNIEEEAQEFAKLATAALGQEPLFIDTASTAIGLHIGAGALALSLMIDTETEIESTEL